MATLSSPSGIARDEQTIVLGSTAAAQVADSPHDFLPSGTRLHEFEITGLIGEGGFGVVYQAYDHLLQRRVALKEYLPASLAARGQQQSVVLRSQRHADSYAKGLESFINEARLLARFDHPALVKVHRFWQANETAYLVMPYYEGPTLKAAIQAMPTPPDERWIRGLLGPLLAALELLHQQDCLHRDIAPDNILLPGEGGPVLLDFGAARRVIGDMTQALTVMLKPGYAPIEQFAEMPGIRQGPWTDLYALGAVLHWIITGQTPPPAVGRMLRDPYEALATRAAGRYSAALLNSIDRCLALKGEDRPQSVAQLRALLGPAASTETQALPAPTAIPAQESASASASASKPDSSNPISPDWHQRSRWRIATLTLAAAAAITASLLLGGLPEAQAPQNIASASVEHPPATTTVAPTVGPIAAPLDPMAPPAAPISPISPIATVDPADPVPMTAPTISLEAAWQAVLAAASSDYGLSVSGLKNPLQVGRDSLSLALDSRRDGWLYLLLWDRANGQVGLLLPNAVDPAPQIKAGQPLRLPRTGWQYQADLPAGDWDILLLVSESRRDFPDLALSRDGIMLAAPRDKIEQALARSSAGNLALAGQADCAPGTPCPASYGALRLSVREIEAPR
ncbi:serine/threonine protein kinase [Malikia spinosa]|uniref:serine/threonine protein kinase n=1 Tax=Malikia spinosa TaxID=86180 RepID=UPI0027BABE36|nr:serine/threonine-protein kinase [Malikia spinosa]